jgi:hypothetical protein
MRVIRKIIIHCSAGKFGNVNIIGDWHKKRGFCTVGYHYIILNGFTTSARIYQPNADGIIREGRPLERVGAHCRGHNKDSIGICLIGQRLFSAKQLYESLPTLLRELLNRFNLNIGDVYGHCEFTNKKTCPNIAMDMLRYSLHRFSPTLTQTSEQT